MARNKYQKKWREGLVERGLRTLIKHRFHFSDAQKKEMKRLRYSEFWTLIELAKKYRCSKDTVHKIVWPWSVYDMRPSKKKKLLQYTPTNPLLLPHNRGAFLKKIFLLWFRCQIFLIQKSPHCWGWEKCLYAFFILGELLLKPIHHKVNLE